MSIEINNVVIGGNLANDVTLKDLAGGRKVCTFPLATNRTYVQNGQKTSEVSFIDVDVWGVVAENCAKYLKKGSPVVVIGRIKQERWEAENGDKRSRIKVVAATVQFLSGGNRDQQQDQGQGGYEAPAAVQESTANMAWPE